MVEPVAADLVVTRPSVGANLAASGHAVEHGVGERVALDVGDPAHPHALGHPVAFDRDQHDRLVPQAPAANARMPCSDVRFVDLPALQSSSRPGRTIARRSLRSHAHAVW